MKSAAAAAALLAVAAPAAATRPSLRVASYNIERYGEQEKRTDEARLVQILASLDADVIAVEEIVDPPRFERLVAKLAGPRRYRFVSSACGGRAMMRVGFVYDEARVGFDGAIEYPQLRRDGRGRCNLGGRPGLLGRFRAGGAPFELLVVHLDAQKEAEPERRRQWRRAIAIVGERRRAGVRAVGIIGDVNSTGFRDPASDERRFIEEELAAAGMRLATGGLACSTYWQTNERWLPSLLDHFAVTREFPVGDVARVHGYCAQAGCQPLAAPPREFYEVSDHCPITVGR